MKNQGKNFPQWSLLLFLLCLMILDRGTRPSIAQTPSDEPPREPPLDVQLLQPGSQPDSEDVITAATIAERGLTIPSLWWEKEQFANSKLLDNWLAYPNEQNQDDREKIGGRVDLVVNRQIWSLLDYLQRYEFVNHFGSSAKEYHYNTRVFNRQGGLLAAYTCDFDVEPSVCRIWLDSSGFQGSSPEFTP